MQETTKPASSDGEMGRSGLPPMWFGVWQTIEEHVERQRRRQREWGGRPWNPRIEDAVAAYWRRKAADDRDFWRYYLSPTLFDEIGGAYELRQPYDFRYDSLEDQWKAFRRPLPLWPRYVGYP